MLDAGNEKNATSHTQGPASNHLTETQISVEIVSKPSNESFSLQALVRTPAELELKGSTSQAQKRLSFTAEKAAELPGFKFAPVPMFYHSRKRTPILSEGQLDTKSAAMCDFKVGKGIIKQTSQMRHKTVSFSTLPRESQDCPPTDNKENENPEDVDLKDSLEMHPQVPKATPSIKVSVASHGETETVSTSLGTVVGEDFKGEVSFEERVRCNRVSSVDARILQKKPEKSGVSYCAACNKDTRTLVVFEPVPTRSFQQLVCCWQEPRRQILAVHKCVTCKRVIARILQ